MNNNQNSMRGGLQYLYSNSQNYELYKGKMQDVLSTFKENSIDSIVCDPPYHLTSIQERFGKDNSKEAQFGKDGSFQRLSKGFMGKTWDGGDTAFQPDTWKYCFNVLKPGGYLLAFGGSRTFHRIACAIEDAGFEIRDTIMWLYGSGFPKSMNIGLAIDKKLGVESEVISSGRSGATSRAYQSEEMTTSGEYEIKKAKNKWQGWGTCLKPAYEPIIVARKPFKSSLVDNVLEYGVGGINIDECRVEYEKTTNPATNPLYRQQNADKYKQVQGGELSNGVVSWTSGKNGVNESGRFPANVILTYDDTDFNEVCGGMPDTKSTPRTATVGGQGGIGQATNFQRGSERSYFNDSGSASRYFYCAKASKKDRDEGLDLFDSLIITDGRTKSIDNAFNRGETLRKNIHPTVKPIELMQYLVRLVSPKGATILDCFMGSGSTGKAVMFENRERNANYHFIGIEMTDEYLPICESRIDYALNKYEYDLVKEKQELKEKGIQSIFDFMES